MGRNNHKSTEGSQTAGVGLRRNQPYGGHAARPFNPSYENIYVNDETVFHEIKDYVSLIAPERAEIVKLYKGQLPIFDNFGITKQIKSSFGKTISYKSGAYLIIEHTEALHVVDVNSGNRSKSANGQEANALDVNLGAADELARQLRLRDMGGIIVVDFIDMNLAENRQKLYERMCQNMQKTELNITFCLSANLD